MKIYYAAPLFTDAEREWNLRNASHLRAAGLTVLLPQEFCAVFDQAKAAAGTPPFDLIFAACRDHLDQADAVLAIIDGADPDSGTCWEAGYAYAKGKPIVSLRTDWRPGEDGGANAMLTRSSVAVVRNLSSAISLLQERTNTTKETRS